MGGSYGGYAALAGVALQQGLYRCAVSVSEPANMSSFDDWESERYGLKSESYRYWRKVTGADAVGPGRGARYVTHSSCCHGGCAHSIDPWKGCKWLPH